jgi:hypothetical protein
VQEELIAFAREARKLPNLTVPDDRSFKERLSNWYYAQKQKLGIR